MDVDARALAHAAAPGRRRVTRRGALAVIVAALLVPSASTAGPPLDVDVERYRADGASASLAVHAYEERRRPQAADLPLTGTTLTLLPRSLALLGRLDGLKVAARESTAGYRDAAPAMRRVTVELEHALRDAGAAALVRTGSVDADGRFVFEAIPAGDWVLIGWRSTAVEARGAGRKPDRRGPVPESGGGYRAISVWVRELTVAVGTRDAVDLTDRNVWFSGVEEMRTGAGR